MRRSVLHLFALVSAASASCSVSYSSYNLITDGLNASFCKFADTLEGTVLLPNNRCCGGVLVAANATCPSDAANSNLTFAAEDAVKLTDCEVKVPSALFVMRSTCDVRMAVKFLTHFGIDFTVRSGGHAQSCSSTCEGCVVVSLLEMKSLEQVSGKYSSNQYLVAQPGATLREVYQFYANTEYMVLHGVMPTIGLGGHYLGGGMGYFTRVHGFGSDYMVGAEIVFADGDVATVYDLTRELDLRGYLTLSPHRALLWALKGSGHVGLGIVTRYWIKMIPRPQYVVSGTAKFNATSVEDFKIFWQSMCSYFGHPTDPTRESARLLVWPRLLPIQDYMAGQPVMLRFDYWYTPANSGDPAAALAEGTPVIEDFLSRIAADPVSQTITVGLSKDIHTNLINPPPMSGEGSCASKNVLSKLDVCENADWLNDVAERLYNMTRIQNWLGRGEHFYVVFEVWGGAAASNDPYHWTSSMSTRSTWGTFSYCRWPLTAQVPRARLLTDLEEFNQNVLLNISDVYYLNYADSMVKDIRNLYPSPAIYHRLRILKRLYDRNDVFNSDSSLPSIL